MKRLVLLMMIALAPLIDGCTVHEDIGEDFHFPVEYRYYNDTQHSLHLKMSASKLHGNQWEEKEFLSADIPAGGVTYFTHRVDHGVGTFSSCSIIFDDGKELKYHVKDGEKSTDPLSPLSMIAYSIEWLSGTKVFSISITDEHYRLAE